MKQRQVDVAIIGAGTAGMTAYRSALAHTRNVVVIEGGPYGTTCARVGCMPSKLLIAAAEAAHTAAHAGAFGVHAGPLRIDGDAVMRRVRDERDRFVGFVLEAVEKWPAEHRLHGFARFVDDHTLQVGEHTRVRADRIVIATGSHPSVPVQWREAAGDRLLVNDDVFAWNTLPASVAVLGAGVIALELAQALHRLGVRVRLYGRSARIGPLTDPALQALTREIFCAELPVQLEAKNLQLRRDGDEVVVHTESGEERFEWVLAAAGRAPNLRQLGLENTNLPLDAQGVPRFDPRTSQVGDSHVFIAGDANSDVELLHEAADEGRIAGDNAGRYPDIRERPRRAPLAVAFTDPQIMVAGRSHRDLGHDRASFETGEVSFEDQGRSRVMLKNRGALRVYAEHGTGKLLGAEMIGPAAEHLGHLLSWSIQRGDTVQQMLDSPFYHPVVEEGLRTALRIVQRALRMGPPPVERCLDCGPGA
jgi:dihydrolipoamide dehydrogenase